LIRRSLLVLQESLALQESQELLALMVLQVSRVSQVLPVLRQVNSREGKLRLPCVYL
jgi:hypothetical protein